MTSGNSRSSEAGRLEGQTIETIRDQNGIIAIIIYRDHRTEGLEFITPEDFSLQLGSMLRPVGYKILPHIHNPVHRETFGTQEVLFIKHGKIEIDFFSFEKKYLQSRILETGDIVLLAGAGHGITMIDETEMVEVKNGPFIPGFDKGRFEGRKEE